MARKKQNGEVKRGLRTASFWVRRNYWKVMLAAGVVLAIGAFWIYLFDIGLSVRNLVARLRDLSGKPSANTGTIRNLAWSVAILLGALAAATTLIFQLVRVWIAERTTTAQEEGLTTDRINKAVEGLGREKAVQRLIETPRYKKRGGGWARDDDGNPIPALRPDGQPLVERETYEVTEPNIEVRIGAIYALERIARDSLRDHIQIMEILCAYIRANAPAEGLDPAPHYDAADPDQWEKDLDKWTEALPTPRDDIQAALEVIGRRDPEQIAMERAATGPGRANGYVLDLRYTNLRRCDITQLNFDRARLENAYLEGAWLNGANLEGAWLYGAHLEGAWLYWAHLEGATIDGAYLEGATLDGAHLEGARLDWARLNSATSLKTATFRGAALRDVDCGECATNDSLFEAYGDASVKLPKGLTAGEGKLSHWSPNHLDLLDYETEWRAYQKSIGYTPPESES